MTYQQALTARDPMAVFCARYLSRFVPDLDPAVVWARARWYGLTTTQLAQLCAHRPDTARQHLAA